MNTKTTKQNTPILGNVVLYANNKEYEILIFDNEIKVMVDTDWGHFNVLPPLVEGRIDWERFTVDYVIEHIKEIVDSNMPLVNFGRTKLKKEVTTILDEYFKSSSEKVTKEEIMKLEQAILKSISSFSSITQFIYYLRYVMYVGNKDEYKLLNGEIADKLVQTSLCASHELTLLVSLIHTAKKMFEEDVSNTELIATLPNKLQRKIYVQLLKAGFSADAAEILMNRRICEIERIINLEDI